MTHEPDRGSQDCAPRDEVFLLSERVRRLEEEIQRLMTCVRDCTAILKTSPRNLRREAEPAMDVFLRHDDLLP